MSIALRQLIAHGRVTGRGTGKGTRMMKGWWFSPAWPSEAVVDVVHAETGDGGPSRARMERGTRHRFADREIGEGW